MAGEDIGTNPPPCFHHLWLTLPSSEKHKAETGEDTYTICGKCNLIRPPLQPA